MSVCSRLVSTGLREGFQRGLSEMAGRNGEVAGSSASAMPEDEPSSQATKFDEGIELLVARVVSHASDICPSCGFNFMLSYGLDYFL